ncbi:DDE transposase family protein [Microcoleus sp. FACHB-1515]|uniref:DDE transposase family protein n=1 Tax=Cyanophyceae TaxID=3028117 RepID=UPI001688691C|nr:DDE transposase family protein [Microcoleus sp. FACHB-1515]MBD2092762.1 DDE transposase family protein [Microcoleus sp. FACHB-1515]
MSESQWYIVKQADGHCAIVPTPPAEKAEKWGPFESQGEAIARRVGLIRSGKCLPV